MCEGKRSERSEVISVGWYRGSIMPTCPKKGGIVDVRIDFRWDDRGLRAGCGVLAFDVEAIRRTYVDVEGAEPQVHMFRYRRPNGDVAMCMWCGSCGHFVSASEIEAGEIATAPCRLCGTAPSPQECERWHTWGACLSCPGAEVPRGGFIGEKIGGEAAPAPQAGPAREASRVAVDVVG